MFADLLAKAYTYLKQNNPAQPFRGIVLFASQALEPTGMAPYQPLLDAGLVQCFYLDELPELPNAPLGLSILQLIGRAENEAAAVARDLVVRAGRRPGGRQGRAEAKAKAAQAIVNMSAKNIPPEEIAAFLEVDIEFVRQVLSERRGG